MNPQNPSVPLKLCNVVSLPPGVSLKIVPSPLAPPPEAIPYRFPSAPAVSPVYGE